MGVVAAHRRTSARALPLACLAALAVAGCGGGQTQDANAPSGNFPVVVESATFPSNQALAQRSSLVIRVRNAGSRTIPDINVTLKCGSGLAGGFETVNSTQNLADPRRAQFVVDRIPTHGPRQAPPLDPAPLERSSAMVDTYPLDALPPGQTATFRWDVTAVVAGPYSVCWRVNADLYGKAHAVPAPASMPIEGRFDGNISNAAPNACIAADERTVTSACR